MSREVFSSRKDNISFIHNAMTYKVYTPITQIWLASHHWHHNSASQNCGLRN